MSNEVACVEPRQSLAVAAAVMSARKIRHLPVVHDGTLVGLLSHRDLPAARPSELEPGGEQSMSELELREPVARAMTRRVFVVAPDTPAIEVAGSLAQRHIGCAPVGILSRWDVIAAARDLRLDSPLGAFATQVAFTLGCEESLRTARAFLEAADVSAILIMDGRFPVGAFGKREAIQARNAAPESAVGDAMSRAVLALPADTPLHHAAAQMLATGAHLITVLHDGPQSGVLTATDFTEVLARLAA